MKNPSTLDDVAKEALNKELKIAQQDKKSQSQHERFISYRSGVVAGTIIGLMTLVALGNHKNIIETLEPISKLLFNLASTVATGLFNTGNNDSNIALEHQPTHFRLR